MLLQDEVAGVVVIVFAVGSRPASSARGSAYIRDSNVTHNYAPRKTRARAVLRAHYTMRGPMTHLHRSMAFTVL